MESLDPARLTRPEWEGLEPPLTLPEALPHLLPHRWWRNRFDIRVHAWRVALPGWPRAFDGLRLVQCSDLHAGCFPDAGPLRRIPELISSLGPDLFVFTGDLVHGRTAEILPYVADFAQVQASLGRYAILGNHDYGYYAEWPSEQARISQAAQLVHEVYPALGWRLLRNEALRPLPGEPSVALLGLEDWGSKRLGRRHADAEPALMQAQGARVRILLAHRPSFWRRIVTERHPQMDLTLSGHTHGTQIGVDLPGFQASLLQQLFPDWAGWYRSGRQWLYVNRGLGFSTRTWRIGVLPEITVMELYSA